MKSKNFLMILAGFLVVGMGIMGYVLYSNSKIKTQEKTDDLQSAKLQQQSSSDDINSIEKDLNATDLDEIDKETKSIQAEINSTK